MLFSKKCLHVGLIFGLSFFYVQEAFSAPKIGVQCRIRLGSGCSGKIVYEVDLCKKFGEFASGPAVKKCEDLCKKVQPVCNVQDFDQWVVADAERGSKDGLRGELADKADIFDENGNLLFSSEKTFTVCMTSKVFNPFIGLWMERSKNEPVRAGSTTCPRVAGASPDTCTAGTVFNPAKGICEVGEASCGGGGGAGMAGVVGYSNMLVVTQNNHFNPTSEVERNAGDSRAATADTALPGLVDPRFRSSGSSSKSDMASTSGSTRGSGSGGGSQPIGGSSGPGLAVMEGNTSNAKTDDARSNAEGSRMASVALGSGEMYGSGSAGSAGGGLGGGSSDSGPSWFSGGGAAVPSDGTGALAALEFGSGDSALNGARNLASLGGDLQVEDPVDYFMMSDIDESLFKRVTAQCRKKEKSLVLNSARK
jgi:hypothetical protein